MSIHFSPGLMATLEALFGRRLPGSLVQESGLDAAAAFEAEYLFRAGYRLGAAGEWIALDPNSGDNGRAT
jgi:hypothetical protein